MQTRSLLITGGAGFMGSAFAAAATGSGHRITILDAMTYAGDERRLADRHVGYELVVGDVADRKAVAKAIRASAPDTIVHFAAESHVTRVAVDATLARRTNVLGTRVAFELAHEHRVPHVVHISTSEVYGERLAGHALESDDTDTVELAGYAAFKRDADATARRYANVMPVSVVRPTVAFGPYQHPEKAVPRWICSALDARPIEIWGDGSPIRQWLAVEDIADAVLRIVESGSEGVFNVGALHDPELRNVDIARRVLDETGADTTLLRLVPGYPRRGDYRFSLAIDRISSLGWLAGDFGSQFRATVQWYAANRAWWAPLREGAESLYDSGLSRHSRGQ